jgi:hypothetical protein
MLNVSCSARNFASEMLLLLCIKCVLLDCAWRLNMLDNLAECTHELIVNHTQKVPSWLLGDNDESQDHEAHEMALIESSSTMNVRRDNFTEDEMVDDAPFRLSVRPLLPPSLVFVLGFFPTARLRPHSSI